LARADLQSVRYDYLKHGLQVRASEGKFAKQTGGELKILKLKINNSKL